MALQADVNRYLDSVAPGLVVATHCPWDCSWFASPLTDDGASIDFASAVEGVAFTILPADVASYPRQREDKPASQVVRSTARSREH